jgi:hypothetical protein
MVAKGNVDKHRYSYSGGVKAQETEKWGRDVAARRYGEPQSPNMKPKDACYPQFREDQPLDKNYNDVPEKSWLRGGNEDATRKPNFMPGHKGK